MTARGVWRRETPPRHLGGAVFAWFAEHGRTLPWRTKQVTPWEVMVSEVMLQQTQVDRVIPKYAAFLRRWPTVRHFARARLGSVLALWSGLGYNRRAKNLWNAARAIVRDHGGVVPSETEALRALPGIGGYTAEALRAFAFNAPAVVCDTNIRRIFARLRYGGEHAAQPYTETDIEALIVAALPEGRSRDWYGALMDFGSAVCTARAPSCASCPLQRGCAAAPFFLAGHAPRRALRRAQPKFEGSARQRRGAIMKALVAAGRGGSMSVAQAVRLAGGVAGRTALRELEKEGLVRIDRGMVRLP